jgi:hypothetical protein
LGGGLAPLLIGTNLASASPTQYLNANAGLASNGGLLIKNVALLNSANKKDPKLNQLLLGHHYQQQAQLNGRILNQLGGVSAINHHDLMALQRSLNAQAFLTQQQQQQQQQQHQQQQHLNLSNLNGQYSQNSLAQSILNSQNNLLQAALQQQQGQPILYRTQNGTLINQLQLNSINGANGTAVAAAALAQQNANANPHRYLRPQLNANNLQFSLSPLSSGSSVSLATSSSPSISSPGNTNTSSNGTSSPVSASVSNVISATSNQQQQQSQSQQRSLNTNPHLSGLSAAYS